MKKAFPMRDRRIKRLFLVPPSALNNIEILIASNKRFRRTVFRKLKQAP